MTLPANRLDFILFELSLQGMVGRLEVLEWQAGQRDASNKWPGEASREWGKPLTMSTAVTGRVACLSNTVFAEIMYKQCIYNVS